MNADITIRQCYDSVRQRLASHYSAGEADAMARIIFDELLHYTPVDIVLRKDTIISEFRVKQIDEVVTRLLKDEPIQYIFGRTRFCGNEIAVSPAVLIPRPETEELVDFIVKDNGDRADLRVLDLCTGSGCIAVSLARALKFAEVTAVDISDAALEVARKNVAALKVKVNVVKADVLHLPAEMEDARYDIIVSNPPYIAESERSAMERNVLEYEPGLALFVPDDDPLKFYAAIGRLAATSLAPGGRLYLEANPLYVEELKSMLSSFGLRDVVSVADMTGRQRFVFAKSPLDDE